MKRSFSALIAAAAVVAALSGCATFSDNGLAARVGDAELDSADLQRRMEMLAPSTGDVIDGEAGRSVISNWLALELSRDSGLVDRYAAGPVDSGIFCFSAVTVPDPSTSDAALADLNAGADWGEFVTATDPNMPLDGRQECMPTSGLGELAGQLQGMTVDDPYRVVGADGAAIAVRMQQVDEVNGFELLRIAQAADPDLVDEIIASAIDADIYVDPKFGAFDAERFGVSPLG